MKTVREYSIPDSVRLFGEVKPEVPACIARKLAGMPVATSHIPYAISGWLDEIIRRHLMGKS